MKQLPKVEYEEQRWRSFDEPPEVHGGYGPSGVNLWIYNPKEKNVTEYTNWSGMCVSEYKKLKCLWCFVREPRKPQ